MSSEMMVCAFMYTIILHLYLPHKYQSNRIAYYDCNMNNFGDRVRERREELKMSQGELGKNAGISQSTVAQIERGRNQGSKHILALARALGVDAEWLEMGKSKKEHNQAAKEAEISGRKPPQIDAPQAAARHNIQGRPTGYDNVEPASLGRREIPVISFVQAGMMTEAVDPFSLGDGFETVIIDSPCSELTFALRIKGNSMEPKFEAGDVIVVDPTREPYAGSFVIAKNTEEEATFKKYRPRHMNDRGEMVFELVPLNDDYATMNSERDHLRIIGVVIEHRQSLIK